MSGSIRLGTLFLQVAGSWRRNSWLSVPGPKGSATAYVDGCVFKQETPMSRRRVIIPSRCRSVGPTPPSGVANVLPQDAPGCRPHPAVAAVCRAARKGAVLWQRNLEKDYQAAFGPGMPSPLIEGDLLILFVGGKPAACVVALHKDTGKQVWKALDESPTFSSPIVISSGGKK